jgi:type IV pilus assembly protein PilC
MKESEWTLYIRLKRMDLALLTRQISLMLQVGMRLRDSLDILAQTEHDIDKRVVLSSLVKSIELGYPLSVALERFPAAFSTVYVTMVKVGEETGRLVLTLSKLADWLEWEADLTKRVRAALNYPMIVLGVTLFLGIGFFTVIFPSLQEALTNSGDVPILTQILIMVSETLRSPLFWLALVPSIGLLLYLLRALLSGNFLLVWRLLSRIPVLGELLQSLSVTRFCASFAVLAHTGVDILTSYRLASQSSGSPVIASQMEEGIKAIQDGSNLWCHLERCPESFPPMVVGMVRVGEETGLLARNLDSIARFIQERTANSVDVLTALLEPLLLAAVALLAGIVILGLALPSYAAIAGQF